MSLLQSFGNWWPCYNLQVVKLSSRTFNYNAIDRAKASTKSNINKSFPKIGKRFHRLGLPPKVCAPKINYTCTCLEVWAETWLYFPALTLKHVHRCSQEKKWCQFNVILHLCQKKLNHHKCIYRGYLREKNKKCHKKMTEVIGNFNRNCLLWTCHNLTLENNKVLL